MWSFFWGQSPLGFIKALDSISSVLFSVYNVSSSIWYDLSLLLVDIYGSSQLCEVTEVILLGYYMFLINLTGLKINLLVTIDQILPSL